MASAPVEPDGHEGEDDGGQDAVAEKLLHVAVGGAERPVEAVEVVEHENGKLRTQLITSDTARLRRKRFVGVRITLLPATIQSTEHEHVVPRAHKRDRRKRQHERAARPPGERERLAGRRVSPAAAGAARPVGVRTRA